MGTGPEIDAPAWSGRTQFVMLDADFGSGQRFLSAWRRWQADPARPPRLHYLVPGADPCAAPLECMALRAAWPLAVPGFHRISLDGGRVILDLMFGAPELCLAQIDARVDAFYLGAAWLPAVALARLARPGATLQAVVAQASLPGATLQAAAAQAPLPGATLQPAAAQAEQAAQLAAAGFACHLAPGAAQLRAVFAGRQPPAPRFKNAAPVQRDATITGAGLGGAAARERQSIVTGAGLAGAAARERHAVVTGAGLAGAAACERHAIVIGAGLAGAAACERLAARGWRLTLLERDARPAQQASGNLAGIFMPQLSQDDNPAARLVRAAFLFALRQWQQLGGVGSAFAGARCGVLQLARDAGHADVQRRIAAAWRYPPRFAQWLEADSASALSGTPAPHGGWLFEQGGWAHPGAVCQAMLDACGARLERRFSCSVAALLRVDGQWQALDADGAVLAHAPTVILANGCAATELSQAAGLPLSAVRGQVTHLAPGILPELKLVLCREAYMTPASGGLVSVGATYDAHGTAALSAASQQENLEKIASMLGQGVAGHAALLGRVGFRCVAPDRLPLVGALPDATLAGQQAGGCIERLRDVPRWPGLYGLLGYASRGLIWAPLAAELLAAQLNGEPLPLEAKLVAALDPARFLLRQLRRRA